MFAGVSWLDFKLGLRMLVKYPGLTLVGGLAVAFAIWVGAGTFELVRQVVYPALPLEEGDRVVGLQSWDVAANRPEMRTLHDFVLWRQELRTVDDLGAFHTLQRNLITAEGRGEPVEVAEISAAAFRVARVAPLLGRTLVEEDERPDAPPVVVLGHDVWQARFGADPEIVGETVRLGHQSATVVGVMPEGFGFPVSQSLWAPLRLSAPDHPRGGGPAIRIFGRLAPGATLEEAQAELTAVGRRTAADFPETHQHLRPRVLPYAQSILGISGLHSLGLLSINLFLVMLLVLVCGNVALLLFARAAAREGEIVVRNALGASRGRIVGQLFAEALVLVGLGAAIGVAAVGWGMRWGYGVLASEAGGRLPFWFHPSLSPPTLLYAVALALLGAAIAGVVPALKVTRGLGAQLRQAGAGGGGFRFGGVWTAVIVAQIALTVAFPVTVFFAQRDVAQIRAVDAGFPTEEYLSVRLDMDRDAVSGPSADSARAAWRARLAATAAELERRLESDPAVAGVTFAERLPRMYHPARGIELDAGGAAPIDPRFGYRRVSSDAVALDYFDVVDAPILSGRGFHSGDLAGDAYAVVVNQSFVERILGGHNPIGRRFRYTDMEEWDDPRPADDQPWYEIVGVVRDMGMAHDWDLKAAGIYHPATAAGILPGHMAVHLRGRVDAFAPRLRALAADIDPTLRLHDLMPLERVDQAALKFARFWARLLVLVSSVALLLSLAGIYAVMAFTVSQRTREIGIRIALGADAARIVAAVFRRPLRQVAVGIVVGSALATGLLVPYYGRDFSAGEAAGLVGYAALMLAVCLLACVGPTRRALRVEPTEALRADG